MLNKLEDEEQQEQMEKLDEKQLAVRGGGAAAKDTWGEEDELGNREWGQEQEEQEDLGDQVGAGGEVDPMFQAR